MSVNKKSVLFICLGNICRSPMAEAIFLDLIKKRNVANEWHVDSAAIGGWHVNNPPDSRTMKVLQEKGISYSHTVRKIIQDDFKNFDYIFGMDEENMASLKAMAPKKNTKANVALLGAYDPKGIKIIDDPYYENGIDAFYKCYEQCVRCCEAFLSTVS